MLRLGTMTLGIWIIRDLDNEMNKKAYNFIEINELSGWNLVPLRK